MLWRMRSRRIVHFGMTPSPNEVWMAQQMREAIPCEHGYRFLLHDRDSVFSVAVDGLPVEGLEGRHRLPEGRGWWRGRCWVGCAMSTGWSGRPEASLPARGRQPS